MKPFFKTFLLLFISFQLSIINCFSQIEGEWTWMNGSDTLHSLGHYGIQGIADSLNSPPALYEPCEWQDQQGNFWLFGGFHGNLIPDPLIGDLNDLWKYNPITNEWTWIKGPGIPNSLGVYGVQGIPSPLNNPASRGWGTPTWTGINNSLWLYGGNIGYNDLWKYDIMNNEWTWMHGSTSSGAYNYIQPVYGTFQIPSPTNTPGTRYELNTTWTDNNGNLWLFGGGSADSALTTPYYYNDLWKYDISINQWVWMDGPNSPNDLGYYGIKGVASSLNRPPGRCSYSKWKDNAGNFYFFGGLRITPSFVMQGFNDVWKYEISSNNWIWVSGDSITNSFGSSTAECTTNANNIPRNCYEDRATSFDSLGNVYHFGGTSISGNSKNEIWHYSIIHNEWTIIQYNQPPDFGVKGVSSPLNAPPYKFGSVSWLTSNNELWVFGGNHSDNSDCYNDLWRFVIDMECFPNAMNEIHSGSQLQIFPNPSSGIFQITFPSSSNQKTNYTLAVINTLGQTVFQSAIKQTDPDMHRDDVRLDLSFLPKGIYVLKINDGENSFSKKLIIQ